MKTLWSYIFIIGLYSNLFSDIVYLNETNAQVPFSPKKSLEQSLITSSVAEANLAPRKALPLLTSASSTAAQVEKNKFFRLVQRSLNEELGIRS